MVLGVCWRPGGVLGEVWGVLRASWRRRRPKKRPRAPKRGRSPSQTSPKWRPRPSQNGFLSDFLVFVFPLWICGVFSLNFYRFFVKRRMLEPLNLSILSRRNAIFYKIEFLTNMRQNRPKIIPKPSPNPPKINTKLQKIAKNRSKNATSNEDAPKFAQEAPQRRPRTKKVAPDPPKGSSFKSSAAYAKPCLAAHFYWLLIFI